MKETIMKKTQLMFLGMLALISFSYGCRNASVNTAENREKTAHMNQIELSRVKTDPELSETIGVVRMNTAKTDAGFLRVQASIENFTDERIVISHEIEWFDTDAMRISTASGGWQQEVFEPRETRQLVFVAPNRDAKDFNIKIIRVED